MIFVGGILYLTANTPWMIQFAAPQFAESYLKGYQLEHFSARRQKFVYPGTFILNDVRLDVRKSGVPYEINIGRLKLNDAVSSWKTDRRLNVVMQGLAIQCPLGQVKDAEAKMALFLQNGTLALAESLFRHASVSIGKYSLESVSGHLKANREKMEILDLKGLAYGSEITGQVMNDFRAGMEYVAWMQFSHFEAGKLAEVNPFIFSRLNGTIDGTFRIIGQAYDILSVDLQMSGRGQTTIEPGLVKVIREFVREGDALNAYNAALNREGEAAFDQAFIQLRRDRKGQTVLDFRLKNEEPPLTIKGQRVFNNSEGIEQFF